MGHATRMNVLQPDAHEVAQFLGGQLGAEDMSNSIVVAMVPQGAQLGLSVAKTLHLPLQVLPLRELKDPASGTRCIGAVTEHEMVLNHCPFDLPQDYIYHETLRLRAEIANEKKSYSDAATASSLKNKDVILAAASVNSRSAMEACLQEVRRQSPSKVVVAVAYMSIDVERDIRPLCDQLVVFEHRHGMSME